MILQIYWCHGFTSFTKFSKYGASQGFANKILQSYHSHQEDSSQVSRSDQFWCFPKAQYFEWAQCPSHSSWGSSASPVWLETWIQTPWFFKFNTTRRFSQSKMLIRNLKLWFLFFKAFCRWSKLEWINLFACLKQDHKVTRAKDICPKFCKCPDLKCQ